MQRLAASDFVSAVAKDQYEIDNEREELTKIILALATAKKKRTGKECGSDSYVI